jgi:hypothetical protein
MLWAVGTSVGIGEDAHPAIVSMIMMAIAQRVRLELRAGRSITIKLILPQPLLCSSPPNMALK